MYGYPDISEVFSEEIVDLNLTYNLTNFTVVQQTKLMCSDLVS